MATIERGVVRLERHEVVAEHQFGGNAAEKLGIDALLAQVDKRAAIALGEPARLIAFGGLRSRTVLGTTGLLRQV